MELGNNPDKNNIKLKFSPVAGDSVPFTRLAAIAQREKDVEQYFAFELTNQPHALFKDGLMRKPDKSRKVLLLDEMKIPASIDFMENMSLAVAHCFTELTGQKEQSLVKLHKCMSTTSVIIMGHSLCNL